jgi:hypothetical protein
MIYSGVDLIRTSQDQANRLERLSEPIGGAAGIDTGTEGGGSSSNAFGGQSNSANIFDLFKTPAERAAETNTSLDEPALPNPDAPPEKAPADLENVLLRFAKFMNGDQAAKKAAVNPRVKRAIASYETQHENPLAESTLGLRIDKAA